MDRLILCLKSKNIIKSLGGKIVDELDIFNKLKIGVASDEKIREWSKR